MLNDINKNNPFKVPDNYFQSFNSEILNKLPGQKVPVKKIPIWKTITKWTSAAIITGIIVSTGFYFLKDKPEKSLNNTQIFTKNNFGKDNNDDNTSSLENDYYQFLEDEAVHLAYQDSFYSIDN